MASAWYQSYCCHWMAEAIEKPNWVALQSHLNRGCSPNCMYVRYDAAPRKMVVCTSAPKPDEPTKWDQFCSTEKMLSGRRMPILHYLILAEADGTGNNSKQLYTEGAERLLKAKADVNIQDPDTGDTALHVAARHCRLHMVNWLMRNGADRTIKNFKGELPFSLFPSWCPVKLPKDH